MNLHEKFLQLEPALLSEIERMAAHGTTGHKLLPLSPKGGLNAVAYNLSPLGLPDRWRGMGALIPAAQLVKIIKQHAVLTV